MFHSNSLMTRIAVAKSIGFVFGLLTFFTVPVFWPQISGRALWGLLFWYTTLGAVVGLFGVFTWHPILKMRMPWWFRGPSLGIWLNFLLMLFIYDNWVLVMADSMFASPIWFIIEGAVLGLLIDWLATRIGGEGAQIVVNDEARKTSVVID